MITIYKRHLENCAQRGKGRKYRRCPCPIWADGVLSRKTIRRSLGTGDWEEAQGIVAAWEAGGEPPLGPEAVTLAEAWEEFLAEARNLGEPTICQHTQLARQMQQFAQDIGVRFLH